MTGERLAPSRAARRRLPELNPQENVWEFMQDIWLSNRVSSTYDTIVDHRVAAWNKLVAQL